MADASAAQSVFDWLQIITLGGLMGAIGQGARTIVGLKKINDAAASAEVSSTDLFVASRVLVSLAIGFIAGGVAAILIIKSIQAVSLEQLFTLAATGYAGTDAIEGFMSRISGSAGAKGQESIGTGGGSGSDAGAGGANDAAMG
jgi:hypothetical protein